MMDYSMGSAAEVDNPEAEEIMRPFLDRLDPALVATVVAYLAHTDCSVSGEIYTVAAVRYPGSSSAGPRATTTRHCRSRTYGPISTRYATQRSTPFRTDPPTR